MGKFMNEKQNLFCMLLKSLLDYGTIRKVQDFSGLDDKT